MSNPYFIQGPALISFSGGRTSGYMLYKILYAHDGLLPPDVRVVFANTGKEREETLRFVHECSSRWCVPVQWLEWRIQPKQIPGRKTLGPWLEKHDPAHAMVNEAGFERVGYNSASREGEPFAALIALKQTTPNAMRRFCTEELKVAIIEKYLRSLGWTEWKNVVGLRRDETKRVHRRWAAEGADSYTRPYRSAFPLFDAGASKTDVDEFWAEQPFDLGISSGDGNCDACLAGETEVVTSEGIKPIRELTGSTPELLVPVSMNGALSELGHFVPAPVRSFGVQRLWEIKMAGHGRSSKTIFATADHRWFLAHKDSQRGYPQKAVTTADLKPGDKLRNVKRQPIGAERGGASRIGVMRGFVFGDGTVKHGNRPGHLLIHAGKDEIFRPLFEACCGTGTEVTLPTGTKVWKYYGIPNYWKSELPNLRETRHFLMGWLAGWFAADGCVSEDGNCILSSARREHLEFARSLCAVLGVHCSSVTSQTRTVTPPSGGERQHTIYGIRINRFHLTSDFFWLDHHRARVEACGQKQERRYGWTVVSVEPTDRVEEVFCATVDGVGAFGLSNGLMTGNCFLKSDKRLMWTERTRPGTLAWWAAQEITGKGRFVTEYSMQSLINRVAREPLLPGLTDEDDRDVECGSACEPTRRSA